jgi:hypothetical protein
MLTLRGLLSQNRTEPQSAKAPLLWRTLMYHDALLDSSLSYLNQVMAMNAMEFRYIIFQFGGHNLAFITNYYYSLLSANYLPF